MLGVVQPPISLVIPVYNGEAVLAESLEMVLGFLDARGLEAEVIVVDDGSTDGTAGIVEAFTDDRVRGLRLPENRGKFAALKTGMAAARGVCRVFTDVDIPYDLEAVPHMAELLTNQGFHIVVGDRTLEDSETGRLIAAHMMGPDVSELLGEVTLAIRKGMSASDIADTIHPHPTISEALREAALGLLDGPIHAAARVKTFQGTG